MKKFLPIKCTSYFLPILSFSSTLFTLIVVLHLYQSDNVLAQATLTWDPPEDVESVVGYKVYYGNASRNYYASEKVNNQTSIRLDFLPVDNTHYLAVVACDSTGNESTYSNEVIFQNYISGNSPPIAVDDLIMTTESIPVNFNVVANDTDANGTVAPETVSIITFPDNGTVTNNWDGTVTYTPDLGFRGKDTFTYTVKNNLGRTSRVAEVTVDVTGASNGSQNTYTLEIQPMGADAFIRDGSSSDKNFGEKGYVIVKHAITGYQRRGVFGFDFSMLADSARITSAYLDLYYFDKSFGNDPRGEKLEVNRVLETGIIEQEVTWDDYKSLRAWDTAGGDYTVTDRATAMMPNDYGWVQWRVTEQAKYAQANTYGIMHLLLKFASETAPNAAARFYTKDFAIDSSKHPRLIINYTTDTENTPPSLSISKPEGTGDIVSVGELFNIMYNLADPDNIVTAALYYDSDNSGFNGTLIGECAAVGEGSTICTWDTTGMPLGSYYVYGITNDGTNPEVKAYSPGKIEISSEVEKTLTVQPSGADTYIHDGKNSGNNYGTKSSIQLKTAITGYQRRGIFEFDFSKLDDSARITSAYLDLYYFDKSIGKDPRGERVEVNRLLKTGIIESEVTWDNYKGSIAWDTAGGDYTVTGQATVEMPADYGWVRWTITELVKDAQRNRSEVLRMLVRFASDASNNVAARFYTKDFASDASKQPKLIIHYTH